MNVFLYFHVPTNNAWALRHKEPATVENAGKVIFICEIPAGWVPQSQAAFVKLCEHYKFQCGPAYKWNPEIQD